MMKKTYLKFIAWFGAFCVLSVILFVCACSGPAAAPPPPIELPAPAVLKFVSYQGLQVDLTLIGGTPSVFKTVVSGKTVVDPATISGADMLDLIEYGPYFFNTFIDNFFAYAINGIQELNIPINELNARCKEDVTFSISSGFLAGQQNVALDFSPFDYNKNGSLADENCSGNTGVFPVCVRLWLGGAPFIAGIFDVAPVYSTDPIIPNTLGKGRFKIYVPEMENTEFLTAYGYEQPDGVVQKDIEYFFQLNPLGGFMTEDIIFTLWNGHSALSQVGPNDTAFKSIRFSTQISDFGGIVLPFGDLGMDYIGQLVQGVDLWGGAVNLSADIFISAEIPDGKIEIIPTCAVASTGVVVDSTLCNEVGGDHVNILPATPPPFIAPLQDSDVALPDGFVGSSPPPNLPACDIYR